MTAPGTPKAEQTEPNQLGSAAPVPPSTIREFERALREKLGFTQRQAKRLSQGGFKALSNEPDDLTSLAERINSLSGQI
jgi:hypothetical protein